MLRAGEIKQEEPEIKQEPWGQDEFTPNIFVKTEEPEEMPGTSGMASYSEPMNNRVTFKRTIVTAGQAPLNKVPKLEPAPVDPWYYKVPIYRRKTLERPRMLRRPVTEQPILRKVKPRFIPNPGLKSQEELEKLMTELEEAQKKDKPRPLQEYPCSVPGCIAIFTSAMGLSRHKALHREIYKCGECSQVFKEREDLKTHLRVHEDIDPPSVIVTAQAIPRTMKLIQSKARQEPRMGLQPGRREALLTDIARRKVFICGTRCGLSFKTKSELQRHMASHDEDRKDFGLVQPKEEADKR